VKGSRAIWEARGGRKSILPEERPVIDFAYATVVTIRSIAAGELFTRDNIWVKRPGTGPILAEFFEDVLGKTAARSVPADVHLGPEDIVGY
jgi:sialic acid synthase SpsE